MTPAPATLAERPPASTPPRGTDPVFAPPYDRLTDAQLLAHLRAPRPVDVDLVVDEDECSPARIDAVLQGDFEFNGERHHLGRHPDWLHNPSRDVEWHILLHKFYYAAGLGRAYLDSGDARYAARWAELIDGWIAQVEPGFIAADVTGRRVQNWIYSLRAFVNHGVPHVAPVEPGFLRRLLHALHEQVEYLCTHLTPKRNHRTLELYAIFLAGVAFPEMAQAARWRRFALAETAANVRADLLPDGVHCELSTDYHHLALRNWMHVRTLAVRHGEPLPAGLDASLQRAFDFALHVHKPDGVVPSLSDGDMRGFQPLLALGAEAFGRADLRWAATRGVAGQPPHEMLATFRHAGYSVLRSSWGTGGTDFDQPHYLVFDHGPLGEGNHGHFDCLSFELAAFGRSLIVDPGRYTYSEAGDVNWRVHFRSTAAHNTVGVDGRTQTAYTPRPVQEPSRHAQGSVRHKIAGPAPEATLLEAARAPGLVLLHARAASRAYDVVHERWIAFLAEGLWIVGDALRSPTVHDYRLNFQLAPEAEGQVALQADEAAHRLHGPGLLGLMPRAAGIDVHLQPGWVSPRYGFKQAAPRWVADGRATDADFDTVLVPWRRGGPAPQGHAGTRSPLAGVPAVRLHRVEVRTDAGPGRALCIEHALPGRPVVDLWWHDRGRHGAVQWDAHRFDGRWLHLRCTPEGQVLSATSHPGARLWRASQAVPLQQAGEGPLR